MRLTTSQDSPLHLGKTIISILLSRNLTFTSLKLPSTGPGFVFQSDPEKDLRPFPVIEVDVSSFLSSAPPIRCLFHTEILESISCGRLLPHAFYLGPQFPLSNVVCHVRVWKLIFLTEKTELRSKRGWRVLQMSHV